MSKKEISVAVGVTGSVAAIKLVEIVTGLLQHESPSFVITRVDVVPTEKSLNFFKIEDLDVQKLGVPLEKVVKVWTDSDEWSMWDGRGDPVLHIEIAKRADILVIAPLDANTLGKVASGLCDNLLTCVLRAWDTKNAKKKVLFCPAMNTKMWEHPITAEQIDRLVKFGYLYIPPMEKTLMCGDTGIGAMAQVVDIVAAVVAAAEIYVGTLLRSGSADVINLAKNFLDQTPTEVDTDEQGNLKISRQSSTTYSTSYAIYVYLIPYEESLGMVLEGAEFYFDSACTYADPDMELAKTCLNLMHNTKEPSISFMFDLIDAMKLFNKDFALNILPQSVRKSNDKITLLRKAMENVPKGYRKVQQLLKLAVYLHIEDMDTTEVESYVYETAGNAGLEEEERDIKFCMQICHNIVAKNYETGWKIFTEVAKDGSDPPVVDHETRLAFINYALNICPSEEILNVLNAKYLIEIRRLHSQLADISPENIEPEVSDEEDTFKPERTDTPDPDESYKTKLEDLVEKTSSYSAWINPLKKISQVVETSRKVLLTGKDTVSNMVEQAQVGLGVRREDILAPAVETSNEDFALESYPLIYTDEEDERRIHLSRLASRYNTFSENAVPDYVKSLPALALALTLNQIWHLEQLLLGRNEAGQRDMKVLEQLVTAILPEDIPWGFGILLSIEDSASFEEVIEKVPQSDACIGVILVILMYRINRKLSPGIRPEDYVTHNLRAMFEALDERLSKDYEEDEKLEGYIRLYNKYKEYISPLDSSNEVPETDNSSSVYEDLADGDGWES